MDPDATTEQDHDSGDRCDIMAAESACTASTSDRGQAEQIDFLNGMVIFLFGLGLFFASGSVLFAIGVDSEPDLERAVNNADQRLVEDLLITEIGGVPADSACVDAYFAMETHEDCSLVPAAFDTSAPSERHWLRRSLGLGSDLDINVTLREGNNPVTGTEGSRAALGPPVPNDDDVAGSNRFVRVGEDEYRTVQVRVWNS